MMLLPNRLYIPLILLILAFLGIQVACTEQPDVKPHKQSQTITTTDTVFQSQTIPFTFTPTCDTFFAQKNLTIEHLSVKNNQNVRKGMVVLRAENQTSFNLLAKEKNNLKNLLINATPPPILSDEFEQWKQFANQIQANDLLPKIPTIQFKEEVAYLNRIGAIELINRIIQIEQAMHVFFIQAPLSGIIQYNQLKEHQPVKKGQPLFTITSTNEGILTVQNPQSNFKKGDILTINQQLIELIKVNKISSQTAAIHVRSSNKKAIPSEGNAVQNGRFHLTAIPKKAVNNTHVKIYQNKHWQPVRIAVIRQDDKNIYTSSLKPGTKIQY